MLTIFLAIISSLLMLYSIVAIIVPVLPGGVPVAWVGLLIFAAGTGFERISILTTVIFFVLTVLTLVLDFFAPMLGLGRQKPSKWAILGAALGSIVGIMVVGVWGIILGPVIGAIVAELIASRNYLRALKTGLGTLIGLVLGGIFKIIIVLIMLGFLIASWF